ncbi:hypothetical protein FW759_10580 [Psychrobacter sp. 1176_08]|uniref:hypothetical protein n=1 Tax=Psychrobacter sp. 1176_08 TaxID=2604452 RepID=UPI0040636969
MSKFNIPDDLELMRQRALLVLGDVKPATKETKADRNFLFEAKRTEAGRALPPYYLVYFLLHDLLNFRNLGKFEKISWSIPIDFKGKAFLIEHRKFGVGVFASNLETDEIDAQKIVRSIQKGIKVAKPYFEWLASQAVEDSKLSVRNNSSELFARYKYLISLYKTQQLEATKRKDEINKQTQKTSYGEATIIQFPTAEFRQNANWLATSAIEAFFSWTEHLFVHLSIITKSIGNGKQVANLVGAEWQVKYKNAINIDIPQNKIFFDELIFIRRQLRNFIAHGAFGKNGETFMFHSNIGAIPVIMPNQVGKNKFSLFVDLSFDEDEVILLLENFISHLWLSELKSAMHYVMDSSLPTILTLASDGAYARAMTSTEDMESFIKHLCYQFDQSANMDW